MSELFLQVDNFATFDSNGIQIQTFVKDEDILVNQGEVSWDSVFTELLNMHSTEDGPIVVKDEFDGVESLYNLVDTLRDAADKFETLIKQRNVLLINRFIEGFSIEDATISINQYIKGDIPE